MKMELTNIMLDQEEIPFLVTKNFETMSHVKGYHVQKALWIPVIEESLLSEREPDNPNDKCAVCVKRKIRIVGHLQLRKLCKFAKTILYFLKAGELSSCKIVATGKPVNFGDVNGMQVPCKLMSTGVKKCIDILQNHLK